MQLKNMMKFIDYFRSNAFSNFSQPLRRRFVWKHISEIKAGRVILLTTHAMEEADLLSDHVAIMCQGQLAAFGSPLELKTKHGSALQFSLICEKEDVAAVEQTSKFGMQS